MGCGQSLGPIYSSKTKETSVQIKNGASIMESIDKKLFEKKILNNEADKGIEEATKRKPASVEQGLYSLPEGNFYDGRLGVSDEASIERLLEKIPAGQLFEDKYFPPSSKSLYFIKKEDTGIVWKRPEHLSSTPSLFVEGVTRKDVIQGSLGDCWFLSSCAAVAKKQKLIERIIHPKQQLHGHGYRGLIICHFWRFGEWVTVYIDDYLPTRNGKLIYARSENPNEFWIALVEKAYAKLHGSYQALEGGQSMDALVDLTGGIAERYDLNEGIDKKKIFRWISKASRKGAFVTASTKGNWKEAWKASRNGLVGGHAYTVSGVARVNHNYKSVALMRIRNPWGNEAEWNGNWSDGDVMWDDISKEMRRKLLRDDADDGEFWMSLDDFLREFEEVSLCSMGPDFDSDGIVDTVGMASTIRGQWERGKNAGGCRNNFQRFSTNPQYLLTIKDIMDDDDTEDEEELNEGEKPPARTQVLVGLLQEHRQSSKTEAVKINQISFCVYKHPSQGPIEKRMDLSDFLYNKDIATSGPYINYREVIARLELVAGNYVIIPATYEPDTPGSFLVRVFSPDKYSLMELE